MKELVILSGKGGTGKTSITAAFASLTKNRVLCDADVDAADLHLILNPDFKLSHDFTGGHDMERVAELSRHFHIPAMVCINKYDLNLEQTRKIETHARKNSIAVVGKISFDPVFTEAMIQAKTIFEYNQNSQAAAETREVWDAIVSLPLFTSPVNNLLQHL